MNKKILLGACYLLLISCSSTSENNGLSPIEEAIETPLPDPNRDWNLVWEDNFDADLSLWNIWESGAFNNEIQLYRAEQLNIANGILTINTERENIFGDTNPFDSTQKDFAFISGRIESKTTFGPSSEIGKNEYRFMASIRMPPGNGMWPAFWSYGDPWPTQGEIDIIEARGNLPMEFSSNIFYGSEVNMPLTRLEDTVVEYDIEEDITTEFHTYELIWTANTLEIKFDDRTLHTYRADSRNYIASLFGKKQQLVINTAVGGVFFPNADTSTFVDNATMEVDWVKVYAR